MSFASGRYDVKGAKSVLIESVQLTREQVGVVVSGRSEIAEAVAKDIFEYIWESAGDARKFGELESAIQLVRYTTMTRIRLGVSSKELLNDKFVMRFDKLCEPISDLITNMLPKVIGRGDDRRDVTATWALDELHLRVMLFDKVSGSFEASMIQFKVVRKVDYGSEHITAISELPLDKHLEYLAAVLGTGDRS